MNIAFFDFDGTITTKDSLEDFIIFAVGFRRYLYGLVVMSPILVAYKLKLISNNEAKAKFISHFFKGWSSLEFDSMAAEYSKSRIKRIVRKDAQDRLNWHVENGDKIVIVSASMENWLKGWVEECGFDLLCTELEVANGKLTGRFSTNNCYGDEKVQRIKSAYEISSYNKVYAYGDSSGDKPMLALADEPFYKFFNGKALF